MHLIMLLSILLLAVSLRYVWTQKLVNIWIDPWHRALELFLLPPLLLFTSAIAIIWMGPHGQMVWQREGWLSYSLAIGFVGFTVVYLIRITWKSYQILQQIRTCPNAHLHDRSVRILDSIVPYSAQIGFWQPELIITQGLLNTLSSEHLEAVLAHEQAHYYYRDTFCFFWLGWVKRVTGWLPQTEEIWQELLVLREMRADRWASRQTDPLLVAEALLLVVQNSSICNEPFCTAFNQIVPIDRLERRIESLLTTPEIEYLDRSVNWWDWVFLIWTFSPLLIVPFHN